MNMVCFKEALYSYFLLSFLRLPYKLLTNGLLTHFDGIFFVPIFFIIFINDIAKCIGSPIRLFADDCVCYRVTRSIKEYHALQLDITNLVNGPTIGVCAFNPSKCNMVRFSKKRCNSLYDYTLEGSTGLQHHLRLKLELLCEFTMQ